ncbi:DUF2383 domain-containing protein [Haliea sp. E1-2-M8]|uniref:DUF2383 domain-containing protein n=1 Tax=Haliea sp. E1-2-M8 TaxID=3064706 RepID=UPI002718B4CC|nr:DUF2383 domain-containing protein [Haliea sp. E1-2-M8]MDO8862065.1 DUF2383 domain-containing protein [Haliea sp. E1-2-M8]
MTTVMDSKQIISDLGDLIELDYDAIAAYQAAIERLDTAAYREKLTEFLGDHERHVKELGEAVRKEGGSPPTKGDAMKILTKGKVVLADLLGDAAILKAMRANEEVTNKKYETAVEKGYAEHIQALLRKGLADERRHKGWIETTVEKL